MMPALRRQVIIALAFLSATSFSHLGLLEREVHGITADERPLKSESDRCNNRRWSMSVLRRAKIADKEYCAWIDTGCTSAAVHSRPGVSPFADYDSRETVIMTGGGKVTRRMFRQVPTAIVGFPQMPLDECRMHAMANHCGKALLFQNREVWQRKEKGALMSGVLFVGKSGFSLQAASILAISASSSTRMIRTVPSLIAAAAFHLGGGVVTRNVRDFALTPVRIETY